jgi:hypothetical protein
MLCVNIDEMMKFKHIKETQKKSSVNCYFVNLMNHIK